MGLGHSLGEERVRVTVNENEIDGLTAGQLWFVQQLELTS